MTGYELASELERLYQQDVIDGVADLALPEAAALLRRQSDQLAAVEKFIQERGEFGQLIVWLALREDK